MLKRFCGLAIALSTFLTVATARDLSAIESYVYRLSQTNKFVPVDNIWTVDHNYDKAAIYEKVADAQPLYINYTNVQSLIKKNLVAIELTIPGPGGVNYTLQLGKYDILSNDFQLHAKGATDELVHYTPGKYYRGVVKGIDNSVAAISFFDNEVYGVFSIPGVGNFNIVPNTMVGKYYGGNTHYLCYNDRDLKITEYAPKCGADDLDENNRIAKKTTTVANSKVLNSCNEIRVFEVGDYSLYQSKGSSVTNVTNYLTALFNNKAVIYRNEDIQIVLKYVEVSTSVDPYYTVRDSASRAFLKLFAATVQNTLHGCDLALLASTKFGGGYGALGGVAYLMQMCEVYHYTDSSGPYGYCNMDNNSVVSFPTYSWNVEVMAHEMGHIVGSPHTHRCCWNPSGTGTTAIDACYTLEGSCSSPGYPSAGGTIMSYCHLVSSVGINFANGFGQQPGDTVRTFTRTSFSVRCGQPFIPNVPLNISNRTIVANRECTDPATGVTFYWNDNATADHADDTLVLMIKKGNNNIGNLNDTAFHVTTTTNPMYARGSGQRLLFPAGTAGITGTNYSMRRFYNLKTTRTPVSDVEIQFPFTAQDSTDVNGSLSGSTIPLNRYQVYATKNGIDPNPLNGFPGAVDTNFNIFNWAPSPSTTKWTFGWAGPVRFAAFRTRNPSGGGSMMLSSNYYAGVNALVGNNFTIYPNPTNDNWHISFRNMVSGSIELYGTDGRLVGNTKIDGQEADIDGGKLAPGVYYYRVVTSEGSFTGSLLRN